MKTTERPKIETAEEQLFMALVAAQVLPALIAEVDRRHRETDQAIAGFIGGIADKIEEIQTYSSHRAAAMESRAKRKAAQ